MVIFDPEDSFFDKIIIVVNGGLNFFKFTSLQKTITKLSLLRF